MIVAVIPARGGSKRIPNKNIRIFGDKPMLAHPLLEARRSGLFDRILVSTDSAEIAKVAADHGGEVPFLRPAALADDFADTGAVTAHACGWMRERGWGPTAVCCIYATSPFLRAEDLAKGWEAFRTGRWDMAFAATSFAAPIQRAFRLLPEGGVRMFQPEHLDTRSQDLEPAYHDAGQFYWRSAADWEGRKLEFDDRATPVLLPRWRVQDIDWPEDWDRAELLWKLVSRASHPPA